MSDSNMTGSHGLVIGTAGHIDHGKTSLIRALTGIDTDRLAEEKKRGISIDLGFAHLALPDGRSISFIDVPGHERFVKNMLAGAAGVQAILLIVAADEAVKPQTREHFEICRFLGIRHGIITLTKTDIATAEQIATASEAVKRLCAGSFLDQAPIVRVSVATGQGLEALKHALHDMAKQIPARDGTGIMRLPIDRSFALKGFGTVVTGTLWNGTIRAGDAVEVHPDKRKARVRGIQAHGKPIPFAEAGERAAVNLVGIDHTELRRGFVLTGPGTLEPSKLLDVSIEWLANVEVPRKRQQVLLHIATSEIPASLKVLHPGERRGSSMARMWLAEPVLAIPGDRFVIRRPSPLNTIGGGVVIDAFPRPRLSRAKTIARLSALATIDVAARIEMLVAESSNGRSPADLVRFTGLPAEIARSVVAENAKLVFVEPAQRIVSTRWIETGRARLLEWLRDFHRKHPSAVGAPITVARLNVEPALATALFHDFPAVRLQGDLIALAEHKPTTSAAETQALSRIEHAFRAAGFQPARPLEILKSTGADAKNARGLLETLIKTQRLVRISEDLVFHSDVLAHIRKSLAPHKGRRFSVPEFKEWTQISRKYAIPLLEYLDRQHVTRREGDARVVL